MNIEADSLNPAVSTALATWLALAGDDRVKLGRAIAALTGLGAGQGSGIAPPPIDTPAKDQPVTIDALGHIDDDLFRSRSYAALGAGESITIYSAGCRGLFELAQRLGTSHYKVGWSRGPSAETRLAHLRVTGYGACWHDGDSLVRESGWDNWEATVVPARERPAGSPVRCLGRTLAVDLPGGVDPSRFDRALMQALAPRALAGFADSDAARLQCRALGIDAARLRRLTEQPRQGRRPKAAHEIFRVSPRQEANLLVRLIEAVVAQLVAPLLRR